MTQLGSLTGCRRAVQSAAMVLLAAVGLLAAAAQAQSDLLDRSYCDSPPPDGGGEPGRLAPAVTGELAEARATLAAYGLQVRIVEVADDAPVSQVVNQWPKPGEPIFNQSVLLCVSRGPDPDTGMPSLTGMTVAQARRALAARQIPNQPEVRTATHPTAAPGTIFGQSPLAGALVAAHDPVVLEVSTGPPPPIVLMPSLTNMTVEEAGQLLAARQILNQPEIRRAPHPAAAPGTIFGQSPIEGAPLGAAEAIILDVSDGPTPVAGQWVIVPLLRGMAEAEAIARLERAGLVAVARGSRHSPHAAGQVIETRPAAGERVEPGAPIYYSLSLGPALSSEREAPSGDNGWLLLAILAVAALGAAALLVKFLRPPLPSLEVGMAGPPMASIDWGEAPELEMEVSADPPTYACRVESEGGMKHG